MTADTILTYGKGRVVVMAGAAGFARVHVGHGEPFRTVTQPENPGMAVGAAVNGDVK